MLSTGYVATFDRSGNVDSLVRNVQRGFRKGCDGTVMAAAKYLGTGRWLAPLALLAGLLALAATPPAAAGSRRAGIRGQIENDRAARRAARREERERLHSEVLDQMRAIRMWKLTEDLKLDQTTAAKVFPLLAQYDDKARDIGRERFDIAREVNDQMRSGRPDNQRLQVLIDQLLGQPEPAQGPRRRTLQGPAPLAHPPAAGQAAAPPAPPGRRLPPPHPRRRRRATPPAASATATPTANRHPTRTERERRAGPRARAASPLPDPLPAADRGARANRRRRSEGRR